MVCVGTGGDEEGMQGPCACPGGDFLYLHRGQAQGPHSTPHFSLSLRTPKNHPCKSSLSGRNLLRSYIYNTVFPQVLDSTETRLPLTLGRGIDIEVAKDGFSCIGFIIAGKA